MFNLLDVARQAQTLRTWRPKRSEWGKPEQWDNATRLDFLHQVRLWAEYGFLHLTPNGLRVVARSSWYMTLTEQQADYYSGLVVGVWATLNPATWGENAPNDKRIEHLAFWWLFVDAGLEVCATINANIAYSEYGECGGWRCTEWA